MWKERCVEKQVAPQSGDSKEAIEQVLDELEDYLLGPDGTMGGSDYLRLLNAKKNLAKGEKPPPAKIVWVNSLRD